MAHAHTHTLSLVSARARSYSFEKHTNKREQLAIEQRNKKMRDRAMIRNWII
jgi:hypothetical protein